MVVPIPLPDTNNTTRLAYTRAVLDFEIPDEADEDVKRYAAVSKELYSALAFHPAMVETGNMGQLFSTPALSKNKVYFMWDFVGRTLFFILQLASDPDPGDLMQNELYIDIIQRSVGTTHLLLDKNPGLLDSMVTGPYPGHIVPEIGDDIKEIAGRL